MEPAHIFTPVLLASLAAVGLVARAIYLFFLAPLARVPGPWHTKFTKLALNVESVRGDGSKYIHHLHQQYGPYVRLGPNSIATSNIDSVKDVHAIPTKYPKTEYYPHVTGNLTPNVFSMRDIKAHGHRRRLLGSQMSESALRERESIVKDKVEQAINKMATEQKAKGYTNIAVWSLAMANDSIGELSFGVPFGALQQDGQDDFLEAVRTSPKYSIWFTEFPFLINPIFQYIPILRYPWIGNVRMRKYATATIHKYLQTDPKDPLRQKTFFHKLDGSSMTQQEIIQEAIVYMIAGTDTTATTFSYLVWVLAQRPDLQARLREELKTLSFDNQNIKQNAFVDNLLSEVLRLYGAASAVLPRSVPRDGAQMGATYVPGGTEVLTQSYTMHRNPEVFPEPLEFNPDRWQNPTKAMTDSYYPFGGGARNCLGIHLARMELRLALYAFFTRFEKVELSPEGSLDDMDFKSWAVVSPAKRHRCLVKVS